MTYRISKVFFPGVATEIYPYSHTHTHTLLAAQDKVVGRPSPQVGLASPDRIQTTTCRLPWGRIPGGLAATPHRERAKRCRRQWTRGGCVGRFGNFPRPRRVYTRPGERLPRGPPRSTELQATGASPVRLHLPIGNLPRPRRVYTRQRERFPRGPPRSTELQATGPRRSSSVSLCTPSGPLAGGAKPGLTGRRDFRLRRILIPRDSGSQQADPCPPNPPGPPHPLHGFQRPTGTTPECQSGGHQAGGG